MKNLLVISILSSLTLLSLLLFHFGNGWVVTITLFTLPVGFVWILVLSIIYIAQYIKIKKLIYIKGFFFGILSAGLILFVPIGKIVEELKSPIVFKGYCEHTVTSTSLVLREDNSFEFNTGAFLSRNIIKGTYDIKNDTITLAFEDDQPKLSSRLLLQEEGIAELDKDSNKLKEYFVAKTNKLK